MYSSVQCLAYIAIKLLINITLDLSVNLVSALHNLLLTVKSFNNFPFIEAELKQSGHCLLIISLVVLQAQDFFLLMYIPQPYYTSTSNIYLPL